MAKVTGDTIIKDVLKMDQGTAQIFLKSGMHCINCPVASAESISEAAAAHGVDANVLVTELNDFLETK